MLQHLEVSNYALIEYLSIDFHKGFSVITGETGAGKSIIMGALSLVLGQRADVRAIQEGANKCFVEVHFDLSDFNLTDYFEQQEWDYDSHCVIRREVYANGKSRAFVNDTPVTLQQLRALVIQLIDIHSQHENLLLGESHYQLNLIDAVSQSQSKLEIYREAFAYYAELQSARRKKVEEWNRWKNEREFLSFQYKQLEEAKLEAEEQQLLEEEQALLTHSEEIKTELTVVRELVDAEQVGVLSQLKQALNAMRRVGKFLPVAHDYEQRIDSAYVDLKDLIAEVDHAIERTDFDPDRKLFVDERLSLIYQLQQKHRKGSLEELITYRDELGEKLRRIEDFESDIEELDKTLKVALDKLQVQANELTALRLSVLSQVSSEVTESLKQLGMPNADFEVIRNAIPFAETGQDEIIFLFSANKNGTKQPLTSIASGGEISRVMLAIKTLAAKSVNLPTIIFDEIDTGISGDIALRMGSIMAEMGADMQVIAITHLPQIASRGTSHYKVYKQDGDERTTTHIDALDRDMRVLEIAEMLSSKNPTEAAIANAKELLKN